MHNPNGLVLYEGPSMLDGEPIVLIATGLVNQSNNSKTGGGLIQTWILRSDIDPITTISNCNDASICGNCPHRGQVVRDYTQTMSKNVNRSCYVNVFQAPNNIYKAYKAGRYHNITGSINGATRSYFLNRLVRIGSYGDPAAVPINVWQGIMHSAAGGTGYTHQWKRYPDLIKYCMASVDNEDEYHEAKRLDWRTFRIKQDTDAYMSKEIMCPASKEAGFKTTCDTCKACGGTNSKANADVAIVVHGTKAKVNSYKREQLTV